MAEEGTAGPSGIVKIKDNFVKITKDRKRFIFIVAKSLELIFGVVAAVAESYKSIFIKEYPNKLPAYKNLNLNTDINFRIICTALDGFVIFNSILLVTYLLGDQLPKKLLCIFSIAGAIYCMAAGGILLNDGGDSNHIRNDPLSTEMIVSGVFAIFAGLTFALEALITYKIYS